MTGNNDKLRSLFLTALMVMSVFAMSVTVVSPAAANHGGDVDVSSAVHYPDTNDNPTVEVVLSHDVTGPATVELGYENGTVSTHSSVTMTNSRQLTVTPGELDSSIQNVSVSNIDHQGTGVSTDDADVTFAPTTIDTQDTDTDGYQGSNIAITSTNVDDVFDIEGLNNSVSRTRGTGTYSAVYVLDTDNLDIGQYDITDSQSTPGTSTLTLEDLGLSVSADSDSFEDDEEITGTVETDDINRPVDVEVLDSNDDVVNDSTVTVGSSGSADFGLQADAGNYTVRATDVNTGVTDSTDTIEVTEAGSIDANFADSVVQEHRGDIAEISVDVSNTDEATVVIGSASNGYWLHTTATDDDGDGQIVLDFNTYAAGAYGDVSDSDIISSEDDDVSIVDEFSGFDRYDNSALTDETLDTGQYNMNVTTGHHTGSLSNMDQTDVARLSLRERATNNISTLVAPAGESFDDAAAIHAGMGTTVTSTSQIADNDVAIFQLDASGIEGALEYNQAGAPIQFEVEHTNPGMNENPQTLLTTGEDLITDPANDTYFYVVDLESNDPVEGGEYNTTVDVDGALDSDDDADVFATWSNVGLSGELDTNADDLVAVQPAAGQNVTGTTNLAPGTDLTVQMEAASDAPSPFLITPDATVNADGTYSATTDEFEGTSLGTNFSVEVLRGSDEVASADGRVMEESTPTPTETDEPTDTATPTDEPTDTATPTDADTDTATPTDEPTTTTDEGPGFGIAVGLIALIGAALLAARRQN